MNNTTQTQSDRDILSTVDHPEGPRFNGAGHVDCRNYDEHRQSFERIAGQWHCPICHVEDYKHSH